MYYDYDTNHLGSEENIPSRWDNNRNTTVIGILLLKSILEVFLLSHLSLCSDEQNIEQYFRFQSIIFFYIL